MRLTRLIRSFFRRSYYEYRLVLWEINRRFRKSLTLSTKQGIFTLSLEVDDAVGRNLFCKHQHELVVATKVTALLRSIGKCPPKGSGTVLDVGANNGVISIGMLYTGEFSKAIAIEPEPRNFSLMLRNIEQNRLSKSIVCLPYAVTDTKTVVSLELSDTNYGDHRIRQISGLINAPELQGESRRKVIQVESDCIDNIVENLPNEFKQDISLMWIDVQGHEGFVFLGAKRLLSGDISVLSEFWPYGILRSGMSQQQFCNICSELWSSYWVIRRGRFVRYPIYTLDIFFDEIGYSGEFDNILFTK